MHSILRAQRALITSVIGLSCVACDAQVSSDYTGESLLSIMGTVEIANDRTRGPLSPALAFTGDAEGDVRIVEVPVHGTFPSDFQLQIYASPPADALMHPTRYSEGEPRMAIAYITAVTRGHPDVIRLASEITLTRYPCTDEGRADGLCLSTKTESCAADEPGHCYTERTYCKSANAPPEQCVVESTGDFTLAAASPWELFAGFSQNYQVIYLEHAAPSGSVTANWLGAPQGVAAGYGLYEVRRYSDEEQQARQQCGEQDAAYERATELYNRAHGTDYETVRCPQGDSDLPFCQDDLDSLFSPDGQTREVLALLEKASTELGCPVSLLKYQRVQDPARESISVVIDSTPPPQF